MGRKASSNTADHSKITLGIDIGGSGIKGAPVDTETGVLLEERYRVVTPQPATPEAVADCVEKIVQHFDWTGRIGCGFPSAIKQGVVMTAANVDSSWIGTDGKALFEQRTGCKVNLINDADAAGLAEMHFGAGKNHRGVVIMITLGTGIGTALFTNGELLPNAELGHIEIRGKDAESRASEAAKDRKGLSWAEWAVRLNEYFSHIERLLWPDLIIVGGGASKHWERFAPLLTVHAQIVPARLLNQAGIIGAALAGLHQPEPPTAAD